MKKKESEEDIFLAFLIKEKENAYINKVFAQTSVSYMSKCYEEKIKNETLFKKILQSIRDFFVGFYLKFIYYKNKWKTRNITEEDKKDKILIHKHFKHDGFITNFYLIRKFQKKTLVDDSGCVDISNYEYEAYIKIEYNELITKEHLKESFENKEVATNYFNQLLLNNKNKNGLQLINELSKSLDEEYADLKKRTEVIESKL